MSAAYSAVCRRYAGSLGWPRCGVGARYGASVSTMQRARPWASAAARTPLGLRRSEDAGEGGPAPRRASLGHFGRALAEAVEDHLRPASTPLAVDHRDAFAERPPASGRRGGQPSRRGQGQLRRECRARCRPGEDLFRPRPDPWARWNQVEASFAQGDRAQAGPAARTPRSAPPPAPSPHRRSRDGARRYDERIPAGLPRSRDGSASRRARCQWRSWPPVLPRGRAPGFHRASPGARRNRGGCGCRSGPWGDKWKERAGRTQVWGGARCPQRLIRRRRRGSALGPLRSTSDTFSFPNFANSGFPQAMAAILEVSRTLHLARDDRDPARRRLAGGARRALGGARAQRIGQDLAPQVPHGISLPHLRRALAARSSLRRNRLARTSPACRPGDQRPAGLDPTGRARAGNRGQRKIRAARSLAAAHRSRSRRRARAGCASLGSAALGRSANGSTSPRASASGCCYRPRAHGSAEASC